MELERIDLLDLTKKILVFLLLAHLLPAIPVQAETDLPASSVAVLGFRYHGPPGKSGLADEVREGLARRLEARGNRVALEKEVPSSFEEIRKLAGLSGTDYLLYGSVTLLGRELSADIRVAKTKTPATPSPAFVQGSAELVPELLDRLASQVQRIMAAPYFVDKVLVRGNRRIDTDAILQVLGTRPGTLFDPETISSDIKSVYRLGYFDDVQVDLQEGPNGKVVTFVVREKPAIRNITIKGNKAIKLEKIKDVLDLKPYSIIREKALQEAVEKIKGLYAGKGFVNTTVTVSVEPVSDQAADVVFEIEEGEKLQIKSISFQGNRHVKDGELKSLMETTEKDYKWIPGIKAIVSFFKGQSPVLKWDALDRDLGRIAAFYHNKGYIDAKVGQPRVERRGKWLYITIPIDEGECYGVGRIEIQQDYFKDTRALLSRLELPGQSTFSQQILRQDILKLTDMFADQGFAYADITPRVTKDPEKKLVNIQLLVNKGPKVNFERIEIVGNTRTRDKVIRRELRVVELEPFSASGLRKSRQRLGRLGYFEEVNMTPSKGSREDLMDLKVQVKERPTGTFSIGAGYSSVDKLILMGEISQRNFLGKGQTLSFKGILGTQTNRYTFSFTEPYFRDTRLSLGTDLYNWERQYDDYTKNSTGGSVRSGYPLTDDLSIYLSFRVDNTTLSDISDNASQIIKESRDINSTRSMRLGLSYDTRNDFYNPTKGWNNGASVEYAGGVFGGDSAFIKLNGNLSYYRPIWNDFVGHLRFGIGYVTKGTGGELPVYERFFIGGMDSVRGFKWGTISPIDPVSGERVGGEYMGYLQTEVIFPLLKDMGLNGVVFYDMGNAWDKDSGYDIADLRKSVGCGIRWLSPMGPLRIEWGYNLDPRADEAASNWDFRIGGSF